MKFEWIPGTPLNQQSLERMKQHFPKPEDPPPVAWFMGRIDYYDFILEKNPVDFTEQELDNYLRDTSGGLSAFPEVDFAIKSWTKTFHYLLPYLADHASKLYADRRYFPGELVGYFMQLYPDQIPHLYPEFHSDILLTLGSIIMTPQYWADGDISPLIIREDFKYRLSYGTYDFLYQVSAAMLFCLKYLKPSQIENWCISLFNIDGRYWYYLFLTFLHEATLILYIFDNDDDLPDVVTVSNNVTITTNLIIASTFGEQILLPTENMQLFINMLKKHHIYYG